MGGIISSLATSTACCVGSTACSWCCSLVGKTSTSSRVAYALQFLTTAVVSWIMLSDIVGKKLEDISYGYLHLDCPEGYCYGTLAVYRICMGSTLFHLFMSIGLYGVRSSQDWRSQIQNQYWVVKIAGWIAVTALCFFIPNQFIAGWGKIVNMPGAALFILIQVVLLIDFSYTVSETLLLWWEESEDKRYLLILILLTGLSFVGSLIITVFLFVWYGPSCPLNQFFISFNLVLCAVTSIASILPFVQEANPKSGLAQSSMVAIYGTYLIVSALTSQPEGKCNPPLTENKTQATTAVLGSLFTFLALAYSVARAATISHEEQVPLLPTSDQHLANATEAGAIRPSALSADGEDNDDETDAVKYNYSFFHLVFMLASMYLAMLVTNWDTVSIVDDSAVVGKSMTAVWCKVVSSWVVLILYGWTVIAPAVLPDRSWD